MKEESRNLDSHGERGAFAVLFSILFGMGLLVIVSYLVIDGGNIAIERRVLQNVAESSAIALAKECALSIPNCRTSTTPSLISNINSPDGKTRLTEVCIKGTNQNSQPCEMPNGAKLDCSTLPAGTSNFVRIRTQTQSETSNYIESLFGNQDQYQLNGCAQAIWGNAASAQVYAPFAFSICQWASSGESLRVIDEFLPNQGVNTCTFTFQDLLGQSFTRTGISGWASINLRSSGIPLQNQASEACPDPSTDMPATLRIGDVIAGVTRDVSSSNYCEDSNLINKVNVWLNKLVYLPLVSTVKLSGLATEHIVEAFSGFELTGYSIKGTRGGSYPNGNWCPNNKNCLYGKFVSTLSPASDVSINPGNPNIGLQAIRLS